MGTDEAKRKAWFSVVRSDSWPCSLLVNLRPFVRAIGMPIRPPIPLRSALLLHRNALRNALGQAIAHSFSAAETGTVGPPGEVDKLVYFFLEGLPAIEGQFNRILSAEKIRATVSGIFCHQTPKVTPLPVFPYKNKVCELGDILFLVTYGRRLSDNLLGNALLVQAKEDARTLTGTLQEHLYAAATSFTYHSPAHLSLQNRDLNGCQNAFWYWGLESHAWWSTEGIRARHQLHPIAFQDVLVNLICGATGRRFEALEPLSPEIGWSKIVDDVLRQTTTAAFHRQNAYISRNKEILRGEDVVRAVNAALGPKSPFLIRSSFGRIFRIFDQELAARGLALENESKEFDEGRFKDLHTARFKRPNDNERGPPRLGDERPRDDEGGGGSFVFIDFSEDSKESAIRRGRRLLF